MQASHLLSGDKYAFVSDSDPLTTVPHPSDPSPAPGLRQPANLASTC